jgi:hypothetical protein
VRGKEWIVRFFPQEGKPMKTTAIGSRVALFVSAIVLVVQVLPARAGGNDRREGRRDHDRVEITFTKWLTTPTTTGALMAGFTGGDVEGLFAGEMLSRQVSVDLRVVKLEATYEVQAGYRSFVALIRGGVGEGVSGEPVSLSGVGRLDGVVLSGWRAGAQVHVSFQTKTNCAGAPDARKCFEGTITIERPDHDDDED